MAGSCGRSVAVDEHDDDAGDDRADERHPCEHRRQQTEHRRAGNAEGPQPHAQTDRVDDGQLEQALDVGACRRVHALDHVQRALEIRIRHGAADELAGSACRRAGRRTQRTVQAAARAATRRRRAARCRPAPAGRCRRTRPVAWRSGRGNSCAREIRSAHPASSSCGRPASAPRRDTGRAVPGRSLRARRPTTRPAPSRPRRRRRPRPRRSRPQSAAARRPG